MRHRKRNSTNQPQIQKSRQKQQKNSELKQKLQLTSIYFQFLDKNDKNANQTIKNQISIQKSKKEDNKTRKIGKNNPQNDIKINDQQLDIKDKINHLIHSLKSSKSIDKYQKQKRQKLKKQWKNLQSQKQNSKRFSQKTQVKKLDQIIIPKKDSFNKEIKLKNDIETIKNQIINIQRQDFIQKINHTLQTKSPVQINQNHEEKYRDYMNQTFRPRKTSSPNNYSKLKTSKNFNIKFKTQPVNFVIKPQKQLSNSQLRLRTQHQMLRLYDNPNTNSRQRIYNFIKSQNTHYKKYYKPNLFNTTKRSGNTMSKSVMLQKIINLRKSFNDKFKKNKQKNAKDNQNNGMKMNIISVINSQNVQKNPQKSGNFIPYQRKMSFLQMFQLEKVKFETLKKIVSEGTFDTEGKLFKANINSFSNYGHTGFNPNNYYSVQNLNDQDGEQFHDQNLDGQILQDRQNPAMTNTIQNFNQFDKFQQSFFDKDANFQQINGNSSKKFMNNYQQNQSQEFSDKFIKQKTRPELQSHIPTYNFDQIKKFNIQKPQIKQLRHKYLYKNHNHQPFSPKIKRKFSKEQWHQYGISIVSVYDKNQNNFTLGDWRKRRSLSNQNVGQESGQIDKKFLLKRTNKEEKIATNLQKFYSKQKQRKRSFLKTFQNRQNTTKNQQFAPWQGQQQDLSLKNYNLMQF